MSPLDAVEALAVLLALAVGRRRVQVGVGDFVPAKAGAIKVHWSDQSPLRHFGANHPPLEPTEPPQTFEQNTQYAYSMEIDIDVLSLHALELRLVGGSPNALSRPASKQPRRRDRACRVAGLGTYCLRAFMTRKGMTI